MPRAGMSDRSIRYDPVARFWLPLREIVVKSEGTGATPYMRRFSYGEVEC